MLSPHQSDINMYSIYHSDHNPAMLSISIMKTFASI